MQNHIHLILTDHFSITVKIDVPHLTQQGEFWHCPLSSRELQTTQSETQTADAAFTPNSSHILQQPDRVQSMQSEGRCNLRIFTR